MFIKRVGGRRAGATRDVVLVKPVSARREHWDCPFEFRSDWRKHLRAATRDLPSSWQHMLMAAVERETLNLNSGDNPYDVGPGTGPLSAGMYATIADVNDGIEQVKEYGARAATVKELHFLQRHNPRMKLSGNFWYEHWPEFTDGQYTLLWEPWMDECLETEQERRRGSPRCHDDPKSYLRAAVAEERHRAAEIVRNYEVSPPLLRIWLPAFWAHGVKCENYVLASLVVGWA